MADLSSIREVVRRARRRLRLQAAIEGATTASILAAAAALVVVFAMRLELVSTGVGIVGLVGAFAIVIAGAVIGALRFDDDEVIARRLDRTSGLSDRLSTAIAFDRDSVGLDDGFVQAAIDDGVRVVERARVEETTPFRTPRDLRAAAAFLVVSAVVAGIALPMSERGVLSQEWGATASSELATAKPAWDVDYAQSVIDDMRKQAERDGNDRLVQLAYELEAQLARLAKHEIDKAELLGAFEVAAQEMTDMDMSPAAGGQLDDVREAIRRLRPASPRPQPAEPLALEPPVAQPPPPPPPPTPTQPPGTNPPTPTPTPTPMPTTPTDVGSGSGTQGNGSAKQPEPDSDPGWDRSRGNRAAGDPPPPRPTRDVVLPEKPNDAPSRRVTIRSAATKGFASKPYRDVYQEYRRVIEDVMRAEKMPASYRYFIKRYFRKIRPS